MICKNAFKKLSFVIMCVLDQHKIQEMYDKVILKNGKMWGLASNTDQYIDL